LYLLKATKQPDLMKQSYGIMSHEAQGYEGRRATVFRKCTEICKIYNVEIALVIKRDDGRTEGFHSENWKGALSGFVGQIYKAKLHANSYP
jgi:hypothetical protein